MILLFIRALLGCNFYNWNKTHATYSLILLDLNSHERYNLGQNFTVSSVNRTTGLIGLEEIEDVID